MHQDIFILMESDKGDIEQVKDSACEEMYENITRIGNYYTEKPIEIVRADNPRFWQLLKQFTLAQYNEIRQFFKAARESTTYSNKIFYKSQAYRAICGWQFPGSYILNARDQCSCISFQTRKLIQDDPTSYYAVIYNYHN